MKILISQLLEHLAKIFPIQEKLIPFVLGMLCGLLLVIAVCLLLHGIVLLCRRDKKIPWIELDTECGLIRISAAAISDLVHTVSNRHPALETERAVLIRKKNTLILKVKAFYSAGSEVSLMDCSKSFQEDVLATLEKSMGITTVEKVVLIVPRCRV